MKKLALTALSLPLLLAACSESVDSQKTQQTATAPAPSAKAIESEPQVASDLSQEAKAWSEQTKKLGSAAWESTKEVASDVADDSKQAWESTKDVAADVADDGKEAWDTTKQTTGEVYDNAVRKGSELYESAKEKGNEMLEEGEADQSRKPATEI